MRAVLVFAETGQQYPVDADAIERLVTEYTIGIARHNGSQAQFYLRGEYPAAIVCNVRSDAHLYLLEARKRQRAAARVKAKGKS